MREGEGKYRSVVENAVFGIFQTTPDGQFITANNALAHLLGYESAEELVNSVTDIAHQIHVDPERRAAFARLLEEQGAVSRFESQAYHKDGGVIWIALTARAVRDEDGRLLYFEGMAEDITRLKQTEQELAARVRQQAAVAELGQAALTTGEFSKLVDEATALLTQTLQMEYCEVLELLPDGKALLLRAGAGWREGYVGHATVDAGLKSQAGYTLASDGPVIVHDLRSETRFHPPPLLMEHNVASGMTVIIPGRERPFGILGVHSTRQRLFTNDDVHFLQAVANVLAAAIERQRFEDNLRYQKALLECQSEALPDGILVLDSYGRVVSVNRRYIEMWGLTDETVETRSRAAMLQAISEKVANREEYLARAAYLDSNSNVKSGEEVLLRDGRIFDQYTAPVKGDDGTYYGRVYFVRDITRRKRVEERLRLIAQSGLVLSSSLDYETTLANVTQLAVPTLADWCAVQIRDEDGTIKMVAIAHTDPVKEKLVEELQQRYPFNPNASMGVARVLSTGQPEFYPDIPDSLLESAARDLEHLDLIHQLNPTSLVIVPLKARDRVLGALTLLSTESRRRFTEDDLPFAEMLALRAALAIDNARLYRETELAKEELRQSNEAKDEFLGVVSHELRSPITTIYGGVRMLRSRGEQIDPEQRGILLTDIEEQSERMYRLVQDLLALARVELGQKVQAEPVTVGAVIQKMAGAQQQRSPQRQIDIVIEKDLPLAQAEPTFLEQILRNLLSNAEKYSEAASPIEVRAACAGNEVVVSVLDRGVGLDPEEAERIFERFYRSKRTAKQAKGIGLGLSLCKRLVEVQGGRIWARPRDGGGLEVSFTLPALQTD